MPAAGGGVREGRGTRRRRHGNHWGKGRHCTCQMIDVSPISQNICAGLIKVLFFIPDPQNVTYKSVVVSYEIINLRKMIL